MLKPRTSLKDFSRRAFSRNQIFSPEWKLAKAFREDYPNTPKSSFLDLESQKQPLGNHAKQALKQVILMPSSAPLLHSHIYHMTGLLWLEQRIFDTDFYFLEISGGTEAWEWYAQHFQELWSLFINLRWFRFLWTTAEGNGGEESRPTMETNLYSMSVIGVDVLEHASVQCRFPMSLWGPYLNSCFFLFLLFFLFFSFLFFFQKLHVWVRIKKESSAG